MSTHLLSTPVSINLIILTLLTLPHPCLSKFSTTYSGTASTGLQACLSNSAFTPSSIVLRENCKEGFRCVIENIPNFGQSILSSGAAILGFIPTVLLILGSINAEIARIHARYPLLALLLSITSVNKRPDKAQNVTPPLGTAVAILGPYGVVKKRDASTSLTGATRIGMCVVHILAAVGAGIVIWQTIEIGSNGVLSWACWTDFYPLVWIALAVLHHVLSVGFMRASLGVSISSSSNSEGKSREVIQQSVANGSAFGIWDLTRSDIQVELRRKRFAKWSKAVVDLLNNVNYLYGTAVFTTLTLISGVVAITKLCAFGIIVVVARIATVWVLENIEGEE